MPASDAPAPQDGAITLAYYDNDLARSIIQGGVTTSYTLDALDRRATETVTDSSGSTQTVRHYTDTSDNPTWVTEGTTTQRYAELIGGDLALTVDNTGSADLTIANGHGDIVTTVALPAQGAAGTAIDGWNTFDEYGTPAAENTTSTGAVDYGWLGSKQRAITRTGLSLMGVRLYNSATGLFTSTDPVEGGNENTYTYPSDPVNSSDTTGEMIKWETVGGYGGRTIGANRQTRSAREMRAPRSYGRSNYRSFRGGRGFYRKRRSEFANSRTRRYRRCRANSFLPETLILMADGSRKRIDQVAIGDMVVATEMASGSTGAYPVEDVIVGAGLKNLVGITVDANGDGHTDTITATDGHPIFDLNRRDFVDAGSLTIRSALRGPDQSVIRVTSINRTTRVEFVYNLTVGAAHTFYVIGDGESILTHNQSCRPKKAKNYKRKWRSKVYGTHSEAERQAKQDAADGGARAKYRGVCGSCDHVHVDYFNKNGELHRTYRYRFKRW